jgi:hypothetical protein
MKQLIEEVYLYEGLIYTHEIEDSIDYLNRAKGVSTFGFKRAGKKNRIVMLTNNIDRKDLDWVIKMTNMLGWYPTTYKLPFDMDSQFFPYNDNPDDFVKYVNDNSSRSTGMWFDAKFDRRLSEEDIPDYGYHVTPLKNKEKILKIGLAPKSKNKFGKQMDRIYILFDKDDVNYLINHKDFSPQENEFVVLKIALKTLHRVRKIGYFEDPAFLEKGFYTYENIPPQYIEVDETLKRN